MNNKGFTLMEILAVLLVIAVIASFAVPLFKSIRRDIGLQRAKSAGIELAESVRSFYRDSKGCFPIGEFDGADVAGANCPAGHSISTGIPDSCGAQNEDHAKDVFGCGYISPKIFVDLPYTFTVLDPSGAENAPFITGKENNGSSGEESFCFTVFRNMVVKDGTYNDTTQPCEYDED